MIEERNLLSISFNKGLNYTLDEREKTKYRIKGEVEARVKRNNATVILGKSVGISEDVKIQIGSLPKETLEKVEPLLMQVWEEIEKLL
ncbi:hypothetical protein AAXE64_07825 [Priestia megaterium]